MESRMRWRGRPERKREQSTHAGACKSNSDREARIHIGICYYAAVFDSLQIP